MSAHPPPVGAGPGLPARPIRLTVVMSHPIQYYAPLFRYITDHCPELFLTVVYVTIPTPEQQGVGFGQAFQWDVPLLDGHHWRVVRRPHPRDDYTRFTGLDARHLPRVLLETHPDVVLVIGWQFAALLRAIRAARRAGIPVLYRGDTNLLQAPAGWRRPLWEAKTRQLLRLFDGYLAVGSHARRYLEHFGARPAQIWPSPHCVDTERFREAAAAGRESAARRSLREPWGIKPDAFVVLFAGKLERGKRLGDLLQALSGLSGATLLVAGSGPEELRARTEAEELGLETIWAGFLNQTRMAEAYAAADVLVLPSERESWGLVLNEALAAGLPCVVSEAVGAAPDLVLPGRTGETFPVGDVPALRAALERVRAGRERGDYATSTCQGQAERHGLAAAAAGIVHAAQALVPAPTPDRPPRILAVLGDFTTLGGLERMSFEVLRAARERGAPVHCVTNGWAPEVVEREAAAIGATSSRTPWHYGFGKQLFRNPKELLGLGWDILRSSAEVLRAARATSAEVAFLPTHTTAMRCAPALLACRLRGVRVVLRQGTAPDPERLQRWLWRTVVDLAVDAYVPNSQFTWRELLACGVAPHKTWQIYNCVARRAVTPRSSTPRRTPARVVYVGQAIPDKGLLELLEAVSLAARSVRDISLDVVGRVEGWEHPSYAGHMEAIARRAASPDLAGRVRFLGWQEDVSQVLEGAVLHVCPSQPALRESFAGVCLEAKQAGLPSLVTPTGGLPEAVRHGVDGWVAETWDSLGLAHGLELLLLDPVRLRRMGSAARASLHRFSRSRFSNSWWLALASPAAPDTGGLSRSSGSDSPRLVKLAAPRTGVSDGHAT